MRWIFQIPPNYQISVLPPCGHPPRHMHTDLRYLQISSKDSCLYHALFSVRQVNIFQAFPLLHCERKKRATSAALLLRRAERDVLGGLLEVLAGDWELGW